MPAMLDLHWKEWLYALGWTVISSTAEGIVGGLVISDLMTPEGWVVATKLAGASAFVNLLLYLKSSPLPKAEQAKPATPPSTE